MAPKYKLTYFDLKGIGEGLRIILTYMGADFEDVRVTFEQWPSVKPTLPFGKLPILEVDGKTLTQSLAISRYLAKEAGLAGKDDWENLQIDIIAETINDLRWAATGAIWEENEDLKKKKKETFRNETLPFYFKKFDAIVKENSGYLANNRLSWVDLFFTSIFDYLAYACDGADILADYPNIKILIETVSNLPQIKKYLEKRPHSDF